MPPPKIRRKVLVTPRVREIITRAARFRAGGSKKPLGLSGGFFIMSHKWDTPAPTVTSDNMFYVKLSIRADLGFSNSVKRSWPPVHKIVRMWRFYARRALRRHS